MNITMKNILFSLLLVAAPLQFGIIQCEEQPNCVQKAVTPLDEELKELLEVSLFDNGPDPRPYTAEEREQIGAFLDWSLSCSEIKWLRIFFGQYISAGQNLKKLQQDIATLLLEDVDTFLQKHWCLLRKLKEAKRVVGGLQKKYEHELDSFLSFLHDKKKNEQGLQVQNKQ